MKRLTRSVVAVTCDIVASSKYSARDRLLLQKQLRAEWQKVEKRFKDDLRSGLGFRVTAGDEFQFVSGDISTALDCLTLLRIRLRTLDLRPRVAFRASIGIGARIVAGSADPYAQDGPAFHAARAGMDRMKERHRLTLAAGNGAAMMANCVNTLFMLMDLVYAGWTPAQARAMLVAYDGANGDEIARRLRVKPPTVSRLLRRAAWEEYKLALAEIKMQLEVRN